MDGDELEGELDDTFCQQPQLQIAPGVSVNGEDLGGMTIQSSLDRDEEDSTSLRVLPGASIDYYVIVNDLDYAIVAENARPIALQRRKNMKR